MKQQLSREPLVGFALPPLVSEAVAAKAKRFYELGERYAELKDGIRLAEKELVEAAEQDVASAAEALLNGSKRSTKPLTEKAKTHLANLEEELEIVDKAVDLAGSELAKQIAVDKAEMLAVLDEPEAEASKRASDSLAALRDSLSMLSNVRASRAWLQEFDVGYALIGRQRQFVPQRLRASLNGRRLNPNEDVDVSVLLDLVGQALTPPSPVETPKRRRRVPSRV